MTGVQTCALPIYRVQEQIKSRRRQTKEKATPIFAGLVKCADCGWSMRFATNKANKTPYSYYACSYYGQFGKGTCSMHYIRYDVLYDLLPLAGSLPFVYAIVARV